MGAKQLRNAVYDYGSQVAQAPSEGTMYCPKYGSLFLQPNTSTHTWCCKEKEKLLVKNLPSGSSEHWTESEQGRAGVVTFAWFPVPTHASVPLDLDSTKSCFWRW